MKKKFILTLVFAFILMSSGIYHSLAIASCPITQDTNIAFYGETGAGGVGTLSKSWIIHFLDWWKAQDPSINYVMLDKSNVKSDCDFSDFPNLKLYIQPGGNAYYQQKSLGSGGRANIIDFIDNDGGSYLGICAGFFYAATDYYWQGNFYDWSYLLGSFPTVEGSITDIADYDESPGYAITEVSSGFAMVYYGGPTRGWRDTPASFPGEALLTFTGIPGDFPAAVKTSNMLLTSIHAEAYENDGISGLTTEQRIENYKWLANAINDVARTAFYVPPYATPPECRDGIDNDGDELVDYPNDPGCASSADDDETDASGSGEGFFDGFEDGNLDGWVLYGPGSPWSASPETSYDGSWAAKANQTGAGDDSFMEAAIDASGYGTVTFEYYRKLVGLDGADDFEVSYYDNGSWTSVEHLGDGGANDGSFLFKSFDIPGTTSKIRFKCECGAVSESCYVDNIKILLTDSDGDGLPDSIENAMCTNPNDADTDDDGIPDGTEDADHDGYKDSNETDPCDKDTDNDLIQDGTELGYAMSDIGGDTDTGVFIPDADEGDTKTDPLDDDSDDDSWLDGQEDTNYNGEIDTGESGPNSADSVPGATIPALSERGMIVFFILLVASFLWVIRRRTGQESA